MKHFRVKNFEKYQPKRNGKHAPWIRLYHTWNLDPAVGQLCDSHKAHWIGLMCIAHATDNEIPWDSKWIKKRGCFDSNVNLEKFEKLGLIEILCNTDGKHGQPKKPIERKREKGEKEKNIQEGECEIEKAFKEDWATYPRKDGVKSKALSCYKKTVGNNLDTNRPLFLKKMEEYVASVDDDGYLKHGETFFRNWQDLEISNIKPTKFETFEERYEREMAETKERLNANHS